MPQGPGVFRYVHNKTMFLHIYCKWLESLSLVTPILPIDEGEIPKDLGARVVLVGLLFKAQGLHHSRWPCRKDQYCANPGICWRGDSRTCRTAGPQHVDISRSQKNGLKNKHATHWTAQINTYLEHPGRTGYSCNSGAHWDDVFAQHASGKWSFGL